MIEADIEADVIEEDAPGNGTFTSRRQLGASSSLKLPDHQNAPTQQRPSARGEESQQSAPTHEDHALVPLATADASHGRNGILMAIAPSDLAPPSARARPIPRVAAAVSM